MDNSEEHNMIKKWMTFLVADPIVGLVIGKGGVTVKNISLKSDCKISFHGRMGSVRHMRILGTCVAIARACHMIAELICRSITPKEDIDEEMEDCSLLFLLVVPSLVSGGIIGRQGSNIKNIRKFSNANVKIIAHPERLYDIVHIEGKPDEIHKAMEMIATVYINVSEDTLEWMPPSENEPSVLQNISRYVVHIFEVFPDIARRIIGRKGDMVKRLRHYSGAQVIVEDSKFSRKVQVQISGPPSCVALCEKMIDCELGFLDPTNHPQGDDRNQDHMNGRQSRHYNNNNEKEVKVESKYKEQVKN